MPRCDCGEALKPDVVLFGELLPEAAMARANALAATADLLLCVGSSLEVYPVAQLPAADAGGRRPGRAGHEGPDAVRRRAPRSSSTATWSTELEAVLAAL